MNKKIIDYKIVCAETERELQDLVLENIQTWGLQPIGGLHTHLWRTEDGEMGTEWFQSMVKYEENK